MTGVVVFAFAVLLGGGVLTADGGIDDRAPATPGPTLVLEAGDRPGVTDTVSDGGPVDDLSFPTGYDALDRLDPITVVEVRVSGFSRFAVGRAVQCVTTVDTVCANEIPVQFAEDGTAAFQYLVTDHFTPEAEQGRCRALAAPCSIVVEETDGDDRAERHTVFADPSPSPPPGTIRVEPRTGLDDGDTVSVDVTDFPPGSELAVTTCAAPHATGGSHCDDPTTAAQIRVGPDGRGSTTVTVRSGAVGTEGVRCGGRHPRPCGISVWSPGRWPRAPVVPLEFARPPGPRYDATRLGAGLATAVVFIVVAGWLARRTDWSAIGEVAAPEIDDASYPDLDAIVAALPPEPEQGAPT